MRHRRPRPARTLLSRVAIGATATVAVVASGTTGALAEDAAPSDEIAPGDTSSVTETEPTPAESTPTESTPTESTPTESTPTESTPTETEGPADEAEPSVDPSDETAEEGTDQGDEAEAPAPALAADYGSQKVRIGVQQEDGSWLPDGATFAGTTMTISITGGVDTEGNALPDDSTTCVVESDSRDAECDVDEDVPLSNGYLLLGPGQTATITPTPASVPEGLVLAPTSQFVGTVPEECEEFLGQTICFQVQTDVDFTVTATPAAISATTTAGQPVTLDVVGPLDFGPDNAVTGVTVTSQPANGTAVVTGELPPVPDPEPTPTPTFTTTPPVTFAPDAEAAPVAEAAPSGTSRIVYTPAAGFVGTNTFGYAVATQNGTLTGVATITVTAAPVVTPPVVTPPVVTSPVGSGLGTGTGRPVRADGSLPSTGGPAAELLALGAALVVAGAGVGAMTARRRSDRDRALVG